MPRTPWVIGILAAIWIVAAIAVWVVRSSQPTPEKIQAYLATDPLATAANPTDRSAIIDRVGNQLNSLEFEERRTLQRSGTMRAFYDSLIDEERSRFLDLTLPEGFRQIMLALNKMKPEKRREIVERALKSIEEGGPPDGDNAREPVDDEMMQKIVAQGMTSFYEEANTDVKLDFAPVIEQIQQSLRWRD